MTESDAQAHHQEVELSPEDEIDESSISSGQGSPLPRKVELFSAVDTDDETNSIRLYDILSKYDCEDRVCEITESAFIEGEVAIGKIQYWCKVQAALIRTWRN